MRLYLHARLICKAQVKCNDIPEDATTQSFTLDLS